MEAFCIGQVMGRKCIAESADVDSCLFNLIYAAEGESSRWCGCSIRSGSTQPSRAGRSAQLCEVFDRSGAVGALCQPVWRNAQSSVGYCRLKGPNLKCADLRIFGE